MAYYHDFPLYQHSTFSWHTIMDHWAYYSDIAACNLLDFPSETTIRQKREYLKKYYLRPYGREVLGRAPFTNKDYDYLREHYLKERAKVDIDEYLPKGEEPEGKGKRAA